MRKLILVTLAVILSFIILKSIKTLTPEIPEEIPEETYTITVNVVD